MIPTTSMRTYPYLWAWGARIGLYRAVIAREARVAGEDQAPTDVIYRREFNRLAGHEQIRVLDGEPLGLTFIVRDEAGGPVRVWYRFRGVLRRDTRDAVITIVDQIRAGTYEAPAGG